MGINRKIIIFVFLILFSFISFFSCSYALTYYINTTDTSASTTSTTYTEYHSLTFTAESGSKYLIFYYAEGNYSSTSGGLQVKFLDDATTIGSYIDYPKVANTEFMPFQMIYITSGTGASKKLAITFSSSSTSYTATLLRARIVAIRIDDLLNTHYNYSYVSTTQSNVNNVWGDAAGDTDTITLNVPTTGYYLIAGSAAIDSDKTTSGVSLRLNLDDTEYIPYGIGGISGNFNYSAIYDFNTAEFVSFGIFAIRQLTAGTHTIKFQVADIDNIASADWGYRSLVAVRLTDVFTFLSNSTIIQATTTSTSPINYTTLSISNSGTNLMVSGITIQGSSTSYSYTNQLSIDGTIYNKITEMPQNANDYRARMMLQNVTLNSGTHYIATQYYSSNSAGTARVKNSDILAIQLLQQAQSYSKIVTDTPIYNQLLFKTYNTSNLLTNYLTYNEISFKFYGIIRYLTPDYLTYYELNSQGFGVLRQLFDYSTYNEVISKLYNYYKLLSDYLNYNKLILNLISNLKLTYEFLSQNEFSIKLFNASKTTTDYITHNELILKILNSFKIISNYVTHNELILKILNSFKIISNYVTHNELILKILNSFKIISNYVTHNEVFNNFINFYIPSSDYLIYNYILNKIYQITNLFFNYITHNELINSQLINNPSNWWNTSFQRRRPINITNSGTSNLTDYQVFLNITYDSDMQPNFADIRFSYYNQSTGTETEISYWLENKVDSTWATVWVKVPFIRTSTYGNETIYVYYKNTTTVSSASNGNNVFIFFEDLTDNTVNNFQLICGSWSFPSSGVLQVLGSGDVGATIRSNLTYAFKNTKIITGGYKTIPATYGSESGYLYAWQSGSIVCGNGGTYSTIYARGGASAYSSFIGVGLGSGWVTTSKSYTDNVMRTGVWLAVKDITNATFNVGDLGSISIVNSTTDTSAYLMFSMRIAWGASGGTGGFAIQNYIAVTKYTSPEPTYLMGSEETYGAQSYSVLTLNYLIYNEIFNKIYQITNSLFNYITSNELILKILNSFKITFDYITPNEISIKILNSIKLIIDYITSNEISIKLLNFIRVMFNYITHNEVIINISNLFKIISNYITSNEITTRIQNSIRIVTNYITHNEIITNISNLFKIIFDYITSNEIISKTFNSIKILTDTLFTYNTPNWWNTSFTKRIQIDITNNGNSNLTDYQVMLNITYDTDMQPNFIDIKFTYYNQSNNSEVEIPYWIENKTDNSWAVIWVKTPFIRNSTYGNEVIYMYYKNTTIVSNSSDLNNTSFTYYSSPLSFSTSSTSDVLVASYDFSSTSPFYLRVLPNFLKVNASTSGTAYSCYEHIYIDSGTTIFHNWIGNINTYCGTIPGDYPTLPNILPSNSSEYGLNCLRVSITSSTNFTNSKNYTSYNYNTLFSGLSGVTVQTSPFTSGSHTVYFYARADNSYQTCYINYWEIRFFKAFNPEPTYTIGSEETYGYNYNELIIRIQNSIRLLTNYITQNELLSFLYQKVGAIVVTSQITFNEISTKLLNSIKITSEYIISNELIIRIQNSIRIIFNYITHNEIISKLFQSIRNIANYITYNEISTKILNSIKIVLNYITSNELIIRVQNSIRIISNYITSNELSIKILNSIKLIIDYITSNEITTRIQNSIRITFNYITSNEITIKISNLIKILIDNITHNEIITKITYSIKIVTNYISQNELIINIKNQFRYLSNYITSNELTVKIYNMVISVIDYITHNSGISGTWLCQIGISCPSAITIITANYTSYYRERPTITFFTSQNLTLTVYKYHSPEVFVGIYNVTNGTTIQLPPNTIYKFNFQSPLRQSQDISLLLNKDTIIIINLPYNYLFYLAIFIPIILFIQTYYKRKNLS